jgi:hypothetical protein
MGEPGVERSHLFLFMFLQVAKPLERQVAEPIIRNRYRGIELSSRCGVVVG